MKPRWRRSAQPRRAAPRSGAKFEAPLSTQPETPAFASERVLLRAVESPLVRGGLTIVAGIVAGNVLGFFRVAVTAYLLGTHRRADSLAVAIGPVDALNSVLINSMVFAFVPMLTAASGADRVALFQQLKRCFTWLFSGLAVSLALFAPWLVRVLAPGLEPAYAHTAVNILRILALSTFAAGASAIRFAMLYTHRRFAPAAFYQASLNVFTVAAALGFWSVLGVYGFAVGYTLGAWAQFGLVSLATRRNAGERTIETKLRWRELVARPGTIVVYAASLALNITFTRAWATHAGPGMAAAMDYCMRGVGVPLAFLVNPISNSLLPEIARLRNQLRLGEALRLIDRTIALAALAAVGVAAFAIAFRGPAIVLIFQRGSFTAESTRLVSAVFLGLGPSLIGWSLLELTARSLFALDRPWLPVCAAAIPVLFNMLFTLTMNSSQPQFLGLGASLGLLTGFLVLAIWSHAKRRLWVVEARGAD